MFLLLIGGVETTSGKLISAIGGTGPSLWQSSLLWAAVAVAFLAFLATNRIAIGGFSFQASRESVIAGFASAIFVVFVSDLLSIVSEVGKTTCPAGAQIPVGCGWEYWIIWSMVFPLIVGYAISLISFIGGSD